MEGHMFECVNQAAVHEELEDETRRLCDVRPFWPMLKLVTRNCGRAERLLDSKIGVLIGKGDTYSLTHTLLTHSYSRPPH
jgi:phosphatidylinositol-4,5-bisphosphate 3-kinase